MAETLDRLISCRSMLGAHRQPRPLIQRPSRQNVESYASHLGHSSIKAAGQRKRKFSVDGRGQNEAEMRSRSPFQLSSFPVICLIWSAVFHTQMGTPGALICTPSIQTSCHYLSPDPRQSKWAHAQRRSSHHESPPAVSKVTWSWWFAAVGSRFFHGHERRVGHENVSAEMNRPLERFIATTPTADFVHWPKWMDANSLSQVLIAANPIIRTRVPQSKVIRTNYCLYSWWCNRIRQTFPWASTNQQMQYSVVDPGAGVSE